MKTQETRGFTLIELTIVITIIAIIAALALPNMLRARLHANESAAIGAIRTISAGEAAVQVSAMIDGDSDGVGEYGSLLDLASPVPPFIDQGLASGIRRGYVFRALPNADAETGYGCNADPLSIGSSGNRYFFVDESGLITFNTSAPAGPLDRSV